MLRTSLSGAPIGLAVFGVAFLIGLAQARTAQAGSDHAGARHAGGAD